MAPSFEEPLTEALETLETPLKSKPELVAPEPGKSPPAGSLQIVID